MDISSVLIQMTVLFFGMAVGYAANKFKVLDEAGNKLVSNLVVNVTLPFFILSSVMSGERSLSTGEVFLIIGISFFTYVAALAVSLLLNVIPGFGKKNARLYRFMLLFGNVGFMGMPVVASLLGAEALFYASVFNLPFNLLLYTLGVYLISDEGSDFKISPRLFLNAGVVASVAAIALYLLDIPFPKVVYRSCSLIGQITTPAAMMVIGSTLAGIPLANIFKNWRIFVLSFLKLIALPVLIWLLLKPFVTNTDILGMSVVLTAMPVATNATLLCFQYNGNPESRALASNGIFVSTLLSLVTIPLLLYALF